jgi:hypothetical protein
MQKYAKYAKILLERKNILKTHEYSTCILRILEASTPWKFLQFPIYAGNFHKHKSTTAQFPGVHKELLTATIYCMERVCTFSIFRYVMRRRFEFVVRKCNVPYMSIKSVA